MNGKEVNSTAAQQCVQRTAGSLRDLQAFSWLQVFSAIKPLSTPAPCPPLTQAVGRLSQNEDYIE